MASITNLYVDQGSDYTSVMTLTSANRMPLDLSNYTVKSQMRKSYFSSLAHNFTCEIIDATAGKIQLSLTSATSSLISGGRWLYDIEITHNETNSIKRVVEGVVIVSPQITQTVI